VPIGGYGVFPKADLSEIYIKSWNNNGTTSIVTFKPTVPVQASVKEAVPASDIIEKLNELESKIDNFLTKSAVPAKKKEINL